MQRKDVEALMSYLRGEKEDEAADLVAALLDRAERAEAEVKAGVAERRCLDYRIRKQREELARLQTAQKVAQEFCREKNEATKRAERAGAERDAAFAAGQEEMRGRAGKAVLRALYKPVGSATEAERHMDDNMVARGVYEAIRDLPIKDRADCASETMAWAVVGEDGKINPHWLGPNLAQMKVMVDEGERIVRVAIRVVEGGDDE